MGLVPLPLRATELGCTQPAAHTLTPTLPWWLVASVHLGAMFPASLVTTEQHLKPALILIALIPTKATHFPRCLLTRQFASSEQRAKCVAYLSIGS